MVLNDVVFDSKGVITSWDHATGLEQLSIPESFR
jgi:hypothetical protein